jgi:all-trans-retinol dehydrogenase (NAD+)
MRSRRGAVLARSTVLITGGASGIGRRMALEASRRGAGVVLWDLSGPGAEAVRAEIEAAGGRAWAFGVDVTDRRAVDEAAAATLALGPVDVIVNNAGVVTGTTLLEAEPAAVERTFAVNTLALFWVTRAFLPTMVARRRGTVVTIASAAGLIGVARQTHYSASKFAAVGFTESLRAEMRTQRTGVGTLLVCPYFIDTGMFDGVRSRFPLLLPILRQDDVARAVIDAIERGREVLMMPPLVRAVPVLRAIPPGLFDRVADLLGINATMDHFVGRSGHLRGRGD